MGQARNSSFCRDLGVGIGLRPDFFDQFREGHPPSVSWVEVTTENYLPWREERETRNLQRLERLRNQLPIVFHGVSLSLGSVDPLDKNYVSRLKALCDRFEPAWISDHLCWTSIDGINTHDLLPLPYNGEALELLVRKISELQDRLGRRILVENLSSYVTFENSEMSEWEFLAEVANRSDCGILLDINNIYVSSVNHGFDPLAYLGAIPPERVGQLHLAGHSRCEGYLVDTHDAPVCDEVWALYRQATRLFGPRSAMLERDAEIPEWPEIEAELTKIARIRAEVEIGPEIGASDAASTVTAAF